MSRRRVNKLFIISSYEINQPAFSRCFEGLSFVGEGL